MKWTRILMVAICALLSLGGTKCACSNDDDVIIVSRPS